MLTATFRDGAERNFQNSAVRTPGEIFEDQLRVNGTAIGFDKNSEVWKNIMRRWLLRYVNVAEKSMEVPWH